MADEQSNVLDEKIEAESTLTSDVSVAASSSSKSGMVRWWTSHACDVLRMDRYPAINLDCDVISCRSAKGKKKLINDAERM